MDWATQFRWKVSVLQSGGFKWVLKRGARVVDEGVAVSAETAEEAVKQALYVFNRDFQAKAQDRAPHAAQARYLRLKRPYLYGAVCEMLLEGVDLPYIRKYAEVKEAEMHGRDHELFRTPLPTHHLAVSAEDGAVKLVTAFLALGWLKILEGGVYDATKLGKRLVKTGEIRGLAQGAALNASDSVVSGLWKMADEELARRKAGQS